MFIRISCIMMCPPMFFVFFEVSIFFFQLFLTGGFAYFKNKSMTRCELSVLSQNQELEKNQLWVKQHSSLTLFIQLSNHSGAGVFIVLVLQLNEGKVKIVCLFTIHVCTR